MAHNNTDDGWDLCAKSDTGPIGAVTVEDSLAHRNDTLGDGSQAPAPAPSRRRPPLRPGPGRRTAARSPVRPRRT
ncbi:hypothetical protein Q8791_10295 [Nocardiopsis sp. CT-R113]|uniref:Uncharacterized protein n=1 Tax=Nocardiopsis codii TaxID=3065942 RepID=A0ABU7K5T2_9ACTN|nr:hypothetical protein [Nocardiopsis sp. CT-R113]MEE2037609.1 hypothetical protein [Nocardiopsis sp. CT-R113]